MDNPRKYKKMERIGKMSDRIALQSFTESVNAYGERVESWSTAATVWASVDYQILRSKEGEEAGQEQVQRQILFTIRDRTVDEKYRVVFGNRTYDIEGIAQSNDGQLLTLRCRQIDQ